MFPVNQHASLSISRTYHALHGLHFSKRTLFLKLSGATLIAINAVSGSIDVMSRNEWNYVRNRNKPGVRTNKSLERYLYNRGYIYKSAAAEDAYLSRLRKRVFKRKPGGFDAYVHITEDCNFRCPYCFEKKSGINGTLDQKMILNIFKAIGGIKSKFCIDSESVFIRIFGGEPLLPRNHALVHEVLDGCRRHNYLATITTNGYTLDRYIDMLVQYRDVVEFIHTTIDGPPRVHNARRRSCSGGDTFHKIANNIDLALRSGLRVLVRTTLNDKSAASFEDLVEIYASRGWNEMDNFVIQICAEFDTYKPKNERKSVCTRRMCRTVGPALSRISSEFRNRAFGNFWSPYISNFFAPSLGIDLDYIDMASPGSNKFYPTFKTCASCGFREISFLPNGKMYSCPVKLGVAEFEIGHFFPNIELKTLLSKIASGGPIHNVAQCNTCNASSICGGGCPLEFYGDLSTDATKHKCSAMEDELTAFIDMYKGKIMDRIGNAR